MAVFIKRFRVRYNGTMYGPGQPGGQVLTGLSEEGEARLIAGSNGHIVKHEPQITVATIQGCPSKVKTSEFLQKLRENLGLVPPSVKPEEGAREPAAAQPSTGQQGEQEKESEDSVSASDLVGANLDDLIKPAGANQKPAGKKRGGK